MSFKLRILLNLLLPRNIFRDETSVNLFSNKDDNFILWVDDLKTAEIYRRGRGFPIDLCMITYTLFSPNQT